MDVYHKIETVYKRDPASKFKTLIMGDYSNPAFEYLADNKWLFTEKVDGTNIRVIVSPPPERYIMFMGKTDTTQISAKLVKRLQDIFFPQADRLHEMFPEGACLYGEGYGAGIQDGGNYRPDMDFVLFDVRIGEWWLERDNVLDTALKLAVPAVPAIGTGTLKDMVEMTKDGFLSIWNEKFTAEGIVARPAIELQDRAGRRIITKIKHRDFR